MKKLFFIFLLLSGYSNTFAFATQGSWRWRSDDGTETTATWLADKNSAATILSFNNNIRVRYQLFGGGSDIGTSVLTYSADGGTTWDSVTTYDNGIRAFILASSTNVSNGDATTRQISGLTGNDFAPGKIITSSNQLAAQTISGTDTTEYEWVIKPTLTIAANTTYQFRVDTKPGDNTYVGAPAILITAPIVLPIKLTSFTATIEGKKVKLNWTTASEVNNDHFNVERSSDGNGWKSIATVNGSGNSSKTVNYSAYDERPLSGNNFYRLKQHNHDGKFTVSMVKILRFDGGDKLVVSVSPNPAKGAIQFKVTNSNGVNVQAVLTDVNGKIIHLQTFKSIQANSANTLNLHHPPAAGMYILKLQAQGLSETIKVLVQ